MKKKSNLRLIIKRHIIGKSFCKKSKKMLAKFFNVKPKTQNEKMEIENAEKESPLIPWV